MFLKSVFKNSSSDLWHTHYRSDHSTIECPEIDRNVKLTWLVLGEDPAARSHRVEQFTAL